MTRTTAQRPTVRVNEAFKVCLNPKPKQEEQMDGSVDASRKAYNFALTGIWAAHNAWREKVDELIAEGTPEEEAKKLVKSPRLNDALIDKVRVRTKERKNDRPPDWDGAAEVLSDAGFEEWAVDRIIAAWQERYDPFRGVQPRAKKYDNKIYQRAQEHAVIAYENWLDSRTGKRAGPAVGAPKFKKKGANRSFYLPNTRVRLVDNRHVWLGKIGKVRTHRSLKRLTTLVESRGVKVIRNVTVSHQGKHWFASFSIEYDTPEPRATRAQRRAGAVGVDLNVSNRAALSTGEIIENPRIREAWEFRLRHAQRVVNRRMEARPKGERPSNRELRARKRVRDIHARIAEQRATGINRFTKRLTTEFETVVTEDLQVKNMTRSAKGTVESPGKNVRQKAGLNKAILDMAPGEANRQLEYKARRYGSRHHKVNPQYTSMTCSECGAVKKLKLSEREYRCDACGNRQHRDVNAAKNILTRGLEEIQNG